MRPLPERGLAPPLPPEWNGTQALIGGRCQKRLRCGTSGWRTYQSAWGAVQKRSSELALSTARGVPGPATSVAPPDHRQNHRRLRRGGPCPSLRPCRRALSCCCTLLRAHACAPVQRSLDSGCAAGSLLICAVCPVDVTVHPVFFWGGGGDEGGGRGQ